MLKINYDYEGRSAISILPSPSISGRSSNTKFNNDLFYKGNGIRYGLGNSLYDGFNKKSVSESYEKNNFDKSDFASALGNGHMQGAGGYYGNAVWWADVMHSKLVPNSEGYPLTQTRYSRDGTGRIVAQGGRRTRISNWQRSRYKILLR